MGFTAQKQLPWETPEEFDLGFVNLGRAFPRKKVGIFASKMY
jgi:hypothetical protein